MFFNDVDGNGNCYKTLHFVLQFQKENLQPKFRNLKLNLKTLLSLFHLKLLRFTKLYWESQNVSLHLKLLRIC